MKKILTLLLSVATLSLYAQEFDKNKMDSLFSLIEKEQQAMGSISIFKDGKEIYRNSIGFSDAKEKVPASGNTTYRIGSISKTFTAAAIMQLIDEEKLSLDTRLSDFFPELPNASEITVEHLLRHRSGLFNFTSAEDYTEWMEQPKSRDELLTLFVENGTVFDPDEKAEYSNTNYVVLSFIAEKADNKKFAALINDRIVEPLQLTSTSVGGEMNTGQNEALSYTKQGKEWIPATNTHMSIPMGAGAIVSTPGDLNVFYNALFTGKVVSGNALKEMKKMVDNYGIGLFQIPFYEKMAFGHTGGIDGFQSNAAYFPEDHVSIAYTSNAVVMPVNNILIGILSIYYGKKYDLPVFVPAITLSGEDLEQYLGVYSSPGFPLKIAITKEGNKLMGQATGQPSFPLEAYELHKFRFDAAMLKIDFFPESGKLLLKQGGGQFELTRE